MRVSLDLLGDSISMSYKKVPGYPQTLRPLTSAGIRKPQRFIVLTSALALLIFSRQNRACEAIWCI